ncbi:putative ubiquitin hydrolase protein [Botrytis fragariae]|uniref:ubiquitinyl hydrolase 1 n=1 Tax=Botrytis fragariae TaxID=1964551 RepID=A0A8H6B1L6_9HELO|nr:putative ubiquitin hydrolase protein [Botrytis fragariae]KAF5877736.1 putative ubiquitin hydrolase protein [Botrytis fragariae]
MNPQNGQTYDLFDRDQFTADDYHQDFTEGLYQKERIGIGTILSVSAIVIALVYQGLINFDYDLLPPSQLAWNALVYLTPSALLDYADHYSNPLPIRNPNAMTYPRTHAQKSEMMRRLFGLDTPGGIIDSVASAGRRRLSTLPLIGGLGVVGDDETPAGLGNWDNSCYQNSILQGLASLDSLPDFLESFQNDEALQREGSRSEDIKMANALKELIATLKDKSNNGRRIWTPAALKNMSSWQQQDAQEYFSRLLGAIDKEYGTTTKLGGVSGLEQLNILKVSSQQPSHTQALFPNPLTGLTATRVVCTKCGYSEGLKTTPSLCQPLIVGEGWEYDLSQLLHEGTKLEFVNGVYCERCTLQKSQHLLSTLMERLEAEPEDNRIRINTSERLRAVTEALENDDFAEKTLKDKCKIPIENWVSVTKSKQDIIARPPKSLALHLNRSTYGPDGELSKKTAAIRFPKHLDLGPYCLGSAGHNDDEDDSEEWLLAPYDSMVAGTQRKSRIQGPVYELRAVVTHSGRHDNGHYICYRRHPVSKNKTDENGSKQDQWWRLSDDHVMKVSEDNVLAQGGVFMLFYDQIESAIHLSAPDPVIDISMQDTGIEKSACGSHDETTPFMSREAISNSTKTTPLTEADDTDHVISRSSSSSNLSDVDTQFTSNESHDNKEITASEGSDGDKDTKQKMEAKYTPTKAILIPQPYMRTSKSKGGRDSSEGTRENNMGGLLMV